MTLLSSNLQTQHPLISKLVKLNSSKMRASILRPYDKEETAPDLSKHFLRSRKHYGFYSFVLHVGMALFSISFVYFAVISYSFTQGPVARKAAREIGTHNLGFFLSFSLRDKMNILSAWISAYVY